MARNRKNKKYPVESWQAEKGDHTFSMTYSSMRRSPPYRALSKRQTDLLTFAKERQWKASHKPATHKPDVFPYDKYGSDPNLGVEWGDFYLNIALLAADGVYTPLDSAGLARDIKVLIGLGFLESVFKYKPRAKTKKVYRLSDKWQKVTAEQIEQVKKESQPKRNRKAG